MCKLSPILILDLDQARPSFPFNISKPEHFQGGNIGKSVALIYKYLMLTLNFAYGPDAVMCCQNNGGASS